MRNIGWTTTEEAFKEFMKKFGPVKYAVLCKANDLKVNYDNNEETGTHKGTGFVKFLDNTVAQHVAKLSQDIEEKLDN